ncbi:putative xylose and arabinose reductase [Scheffersomyces xylosifermentans]|uniref:putative xylose and arabinose reductase n=1 Tax=Scheffersomyces xylosifermentans TaxID=1304137 RepID=UPI00315D67A8
MSLRQIKLNSGNFIPSIGLGCYDIPRSETSNVVYEACKVGYRHFDTAVLYGNEAEVANGIVKYLKENPKEKRSNFFYTTKLWNSQLGASKTPQAIEEIIAKSGDLGYIDLLLIHSPLTGKRSRLESYAIMQKYVDKGLIKNIGVSNYGKHHIEELLHWEHLKYPPAVNQIEISPWVMRTELANWCLSQGINVEAYAPLTHGYKLVETPDSPLAKTCKKYHKSYAQVLIKWSLTKGYIPLPKTKTIGRLAENLTINDFELTSEDLEELDQPDAYEPTDWECTDAP